MTKEDIIWHLCKVIEDPRLRYGVLGDKYAMQEHFNTVIKLLTKIIEDEKNG